MPLVKNGNADLGQGRDEAGWDVLCDGPVIAGVGPASAPRAPTSSTLPGAASIPVWCSACAPWAP